MKKGVAHPISKKTGYELKGKIIKLGTFDEVYKVNLSLLFVSV